MKLIKESFFSLNVYGNMSYAFTLSHHHLMLITFIRHSKTEPNSEIPIVLWGLTDEGIKRASDLSQSDDIRKIEVMYASLQTKAIETGLLLAKPNTIPMKFNNGLTEVTSFTINYEPDFELYQKKSDDMYSAIVERIDGGESLAEALERFNKTLNEIVSEEKDKNNIGIVSHGNMLGLFTSQYINKPPKEIQTSLKMPDYAIFDWDNKKFIKNFSQL